MHAVTTLLNLAETTLVLEDMLSPTYFPTLMAKMHFLRFNVCWGPLLLSTYASNVGTTVLDDVDCVQLYWEMLDNTAGDCWMSSMLFFTLINIAGLCFLVNIRQLCSSTYFEKQCTHNHLPHRRKNTKVALRCRTRNGPSRNKWCFPL